MPFRMLLAKPVRACGVWAESGACASVRLALGLPATGMVLLLCVDSVRAAKLDPPGLSGICRPGLSSPPAVLGVLTLRSCWASCGELSRPGSV